MRRALGEMRIDGIKTTIATSTSAQEYTGAALNGAYLVSNTSLNPPRRATVSSAASVGSYNLSAIVFTGTRNGVVVTDSLTLTDADGNETIRGTQVFDTIAKINTPVMVDGSGAFTFGVGDVCTYETLKMVIKPHATGVLALEYLGGTFSDSIPVTAHQYEPAACTAVLADQGLSSPTDTNFTCYFL